MVEEFESTKAVEPAVDASKTSMSKDDETGEEKPQRRARKKIASDVSDAPSGNTAAADGTSGVEAQTATKSATKKATSRKRAATKRTTSRKKDEAMATGETAVEAPAVNASAVDAQTAEMPALSVDAPAADAPAVNAPAASGVKTPAARKVGRPRRKAATEGQATDKNVETGSVENDASKVKDAASTQNSANHQSVASVEDVAKASSDADSSSREAEKTPAHTAARTTRARSKAAKDAAPSTIAAAASDDGGRHFAASAIADVAGRPSDASAAASAAPAVPADAVDAPAENAPLQDDASKRAGKEPSREVTPDLAAEQLSADQQSARKRRSRVSDAVQQAPEDAAPETTAQEESFAQESEASRETSLDAAAAATSAAAETSSGRIKRERSDRSDRSDRADHGDRAERGERGDRSDRSKKRGKQQNQNQGASNDKNNGQNSNNQQNQGKNGKGSFDRDHRRQRRQHGNREVLPSISRDEFAEMKVGDLREKAAEYGIDASGYRKAELVDVVFEALCKAEGIIEVTGILDIMNDGYGFLRTKGYLPSESDAYVSLSIIRRNGLRKGDYVVGLTRPAQNNEKYAAIQKVISVNDIPADEMGGRVRFADLTPIYPDERLIMEHGKTTTTARIIDLVSPIGKGQRGLIVSPPKAGKTTVLKDVAAAISANNPEVHLMCLLVDERPEEVTDMERSIKGEVISSTFDKPCENHIAVAELVIERAKRLVEQGRDVVILLDSITRLARAYNMGTPASGRILSGGVDSSALYPPKRFLGAARNIENGGSLTILGTALVDTGSKMDEVIFEEFKGTGNMELKLDRSLAEKRIFPAIDPITSSTRKEELLLDPQEAPLIWAVRRVLANLNNTERAMDTLVKSIKQTETNQEFLIRFARKAQTSSKQDSLDL